MEFSSTRSVKVAQLSSANPHQFPNDLNFGILGNEEISVKLKQKIVDGKILPVCGRQEEVF